MIRFLLFFPSELSLKKKNFSVSEIIITRGKEGGVSALLAEATLATVDVKLLHAPQEEMKFCLEKKYFRLHILKELVLI